MWFDYYLCIIVKKAYHEKNALRFYCEKICWTHYLHFALETHVPSQFWKIFLLKIWKLLSALFARFSEIYLSQIINYWGSIFTLHLTWGAFSVVCVLSVFFFFLSSFSNLFFYWYSLWQTLPIHRIIGKGEGIIIFLVFHFLLLTNISLVHRDFYYFFLIDLFAIIRLTADGTCSPSRFAFYSHFHWCN